MKYLTTLIAIIFVTSILTPTTFAASSSSSATATSSNGGTSTAISSSQATDNGIAVSTSNADSTKGGSTTAVSSSTAKKNEVVVSSSNTVSPNSSSVTTSTTVNGKTTTTSTNSGAKYTTGSFFYDSSESIKNLPSNIIIVNVSQPPHLYTEKQIVNGTTIYVFNPTNITSLQISDALVPPNVSVNIPDLTNTNTANASNLTYSISTENTNKQPSLLKIIWNFFHL